MATTTNYGWPTPDDTSLVRDGADAIRTLGSSVDSSLVDLLGGTTGQVLTKASGTDLDFSFTTPASGDFTLISRTSFSNVAGQEFNNVFDTTFPTYRIVIEQMFASTASDRAQFQVITSGGTQITTYFGATAVIKFDAAQLNAVLNTNNGSAFSLSNVDIGNAAITCSSFSLDIARAGISDRARWFGLGMGLDQGKVFWFGGYRAVTETVTGFKILASTSNITGTVAIYGYGA